jgi:hypothetical protein
MRFHASRVTLEAAERGHNPTFAFGGNSMVLWKCRAALYYAKIAQHIDSSHRQNDTSRF